MQVLFIFDINFHGLALNFSQGPLEIQRLDFTIGYPFFYYNMYMYFYVLCEYIKSRVVPYLCLYISCTMSASCPAVHLSSCPLVQPSSLSSCMGVFSLCSRPMCPVDQFTEFVQPSSCPLCPVCPLCPLCPAVHLSTLSSRLVVQLCGSVTNSKAAP